MNHFIHTPKKDAVFILRSWGIAWQSNESVKELIKYFHNYFYSILCVKWSGHWCELSQAKNVNCHKSPGRRFFFLLLLTWLTINLRNRQRCSWETNWLISAVRHGLVLGSLRKQICCSAVLQFTHKSWLWWCRFFYKQLHFQYMLFWKQLQYQNAGCWISPKAGQKKGMTDEFAS